MSTQSVPLTYESVLGLIEKVTAQIERMSQENALQMKETDRKIQATTDQMKENAEQMKMQTAETDRKIQATAEQMKETDRKIQATAAQIEATDQIVQKTAEQIEATNQAVGALTHKVGDMVEKLLGEGNLVDQFRELGHKVKAHSQKKKFGVKGTADSGEIDLFLEDGDVAILVEAKTTLKMDHVREHIKRIEKYRRFVDADGSNGKRFVGAVAGTVIAENVINYAHENGLYVIIQSARAVEIIPQPDGFVAKKW